MASGTSDDAIAIYEGHADTLRIRYDAVSSDDVLGAVADLLPGAGARALDVGAGSGRDAAWLTGRGLRVTAVEPVADFRAAISSRVPGVEVRDTRLPDLAGIAGPFDMILASAVWHHLPIIERDGAMARMAGLLAASGRLILSLRHGPAPLGQPVHALDSDEEIGRGVAAGLVLCRSADTPSHQAANIAAGITWTWLVFEKEAHE